MGTAVRREAEKLRARAEEIAYALLCVGPADLSITSRTQRLGSARHDPEVMASVEGWLRQDLALHADREGMAILGEPEYVLDLDERGCRTVTVLALTLRWSALRLPEKLGQREHQG